MSVGGAFTTTLHLKRNFCETSLRKEPSEIDREMADEIFNSKLKIDQIKWIAQAGISDVPVYFTDYGNASNNPYVVTGQNMGGHRLTSSEIFDYLKTIVEHNDLMGKFHSTDNKNPYVCTTFVCVNLRTRDSGDFASWFGNNSEGKLYYKKFEVEIWTE